MPEVKKAVRTPSQVLDKVRESVEKIKSDRLQEFPVAASIGDYVRQGDIYIELIKSVPSNSSEMIKLNLQLAPGNTRGSRHILDSDEGVRMFKLDNADELEGPILQLFEDRVITHPEHGNFKLNAGCIYSITYQRQHAEELRRVLD